MIMSGIGFGSARLSDAGRLLGGIGAAFGAFAPFLALLVTIPSLVCTDGRCETFSGSVTGFATRQEPLRILSIFLSWSPYLDNAEERDDPVQRCRPEGSQTPPPVRLTDFEFPQSFETDSFPRRARFACILTRGDGRILAARLPQPIFGGQADREMIATIMAKGRFSGRGGDAIGWQRVRLNPGEFAERPVPMIL